MKRISVVFLEVTFVFSGKLRKIWVKVLQKFACCAYMLLKAAGFRAKGVQASNHASFHHTTIDH